MRNAFLLILLFSSAAQAQSRNLRVAVTFDDVPGVAVARCSPIALNRRLLTALDRHRIPAAALVVTGPERCGGDQLTRIVRTWVEHGHEIGSHTHKHRDINQLRLDAYLADVDTAHIRLTAILQPRGLQVRYFRHPFLHVGNTPAKKQGLERHLRSKGYRIAVVTIDNQEWIFADAYARAKQRGVRPRMDSVVVAYLAHIDSSFAYYEDLTQRIFQRQIPQVLLLHANELNADHFDDVVRIIRARGYGFVRLSEALRDPAYGRTDSYVGSAGMSWLQRWARDAKVSFEPEPREPAWLRTR